jgi:hypothetical protein
VAIELAVSWKPKVSVEDERGQDDRDHDDGHGSPPI